MTDYSNTLFVHHHLGLGDHVVCNGMVRFIAKHSNCKSIKLVTKHRNETSVKKMYRDDPRITFHLVDEDADFYRSELDWEKILLIRAGFEMCRKNDWATSLYDSVGIHFAERWKSFYYERDTNEEQQLLSALNLPKEFILVHDVSSVGAFDLKISSKLPIVKVSPIDSYSIFAWLGVVQQAKEVHCIDSSFAHIVESFGQINPNLFFHDVKNDGVVFPRLHYWNFVSYYRIST